MKIVNIDYEQKLFNEELEKFESSKMNQEFEYLLFWTRPENEYWSTKNYNSDFLERIHQKIGTEIRIVKDLGGDIEPLWGNFDNADFKRKVNSKQSCWEVINSAGLLEIESTLLKSHPDNFKEGYVYKECTNFSGRGFVVKGPDEIAKLNLPIICEPVLDRKFDFSFVNYGDKNARFIIENYVDRNFHYKGTKFYPDISFPHKFLSDFKNKVIPLLVQKLSLKEKDNWSIDSFLYHTEKDELRLYPASEVNYRMTMGCIAFDLKNKFAGEYDFFEFLIFKNQKVEQLDYSDEEGGYLILSPNDTKFQTGIFWANESKYLEKLKSSFNR